MGTLKSLTEPVLISKYPTAIHRVLKIRRNPNTLQQRRNGARVLRDDVVTSPCADEAIDATAETFTSGRISALKEMKT